MDIQWSMNVIITTIDLQSSQKIVSQNKVSFAEILYDMTYNYVTITMINLQSIQYRLCGSPLNNMCCYQLKTYSGLHVITL